MNPSELAVSGGVPVRETLLPIARPSIEEEDIQSWVEVIRSGSLSRGPLVQEFEQRFAERLEVAHAVAVSSGTAALHLAMRALELPAGSEVLVPSLTFVATAFAALYCDLKPVFIEVDESLNMNPDDLERKITNRTRAVIPVHYGGQPASMAPILALARDKGLFVIEDACHAPGATYEGRQAGTLGDIGVFSLFATKNITAGEGGVVVTNSPQLAERVRLLRAHGIVPLADQPRAPGNYDVTDVGYNYHLSHLNLAVAIPQLRRLDALNGARQKNARRLTELLASVEGVTLPTVLPDRTHVFHLYTILLEGSVADKRDRIIEALLGEGIQSGIYYRPVHLFSVFRRRYGYSEGSLPATEDLCRRLLTLPLYPQLTPKDLEDVTRALTKVIIYYRGVHS